METNGAPRAQRGSFAPTPSGFRRLTPGLLQADRTAESFAGLPDGVTTPGQLLAAFKAAASRLGRKRCSATLRRLVRLGWLLGRRPGPRHQFVDAFLRPAVHEACQEIGEIGLRIDAI
jgi:hypothetical protein